MLTWVPGTPGSSFEDYEYAFKSGYVNHQDVGYFGGDNFYRFLYQARHLGGDLASIHSQEENDFIMNLIGGTGYWYKSYFGFWRPNGVVNGPWEWTDGTAVTFNAMPASENDNNAHYAKIADHSTQWKTESAGGIQRAVYKRKRFPHISNINEVKITGKGIDISGNNSIIINDTSGIKLNDVFSVNASQIDISCTMNQFGNISSNAIYTRGTEIYLTDACGNGGLTWFSGENEFSEYEYAFYNGVHQVLTVVHAENDI